jgi:hypothetical protein
MRTVLGHRQTRLGNEENTVKQLITLSSCAPGRRSKWCNPRTVAGSTQRSTQRGQLLLVMAVVIVIAFGAAYYALSSPTSVGIERDKITTAALAQIKEALIGWSAARDPAIDGVNARPGELPCPDINPLDGYEDGSCVAGALGRVPWKTLGIPEPKDGSGETLWYTIAGPFRNYNMSSPPITSDTQGDITVYQDAPATTLTTPASTAAVVTTRAVAVIFAPGAVLGTQNRSSTATMACAAPSGTYLRNLCASNYLETWSSVNNSAINGPFIQARSSNDFNDRLLFITNADLMPLVEQRVAREMISYLNQYRATTGVYPWADLGDGNSNGKVNNPSPYNAYNRNRFPCGTALQYNWGRTTAPVTPALPNWLTNGCDLSGGSLTGWISVVYYAVAQNRLQANGFRCTTCTASTLTVTNSTNSIATECTTAAPPTCTTKVLASGSADVVLITPGGDPTGSTARFWSQTAWSTITGYFFDSNSTVSTDNGDNNDDSLRVPTSTANNRVRMYVVR